MEGIKQLLETCQAEIQIKTAEVNSLRESLNGMIKLYNIYYELYNAVSKQRDNYKADLEKLQNTLMEECPNEISE